MGIVSRPEGSASGFLFSPLPLSALVPLRKSVHQMRAFCNSSTFVIGGLRASPSSSTGSRSRIGVARNDVTEDGSTMTGSSRSSKSSSSSSFCRSSSGMVGASSRIVFLDSLSDNLVPRFRSTADAALALGLNLFTMQRAAALFPAAVGSTFLNAATGALAGSGGLAALSGIGGISIPLLVSCVPIVAPFNTPPVAYHNWVQNRRAVAFQRSLMYLCIAQGVLAVAKFFTGNLIGGFFDAMIAGTGIYAASPQGVTMLSTYLTFAGFNGLMDIMQLIQMYHGVIPIYLLPFQYPAFRPLLLLLGCYMTYEFHKELTANFLGYQCAGAQDSWFVSIMGHSAWGTPPGCSDAEARRQEMVGQPQTLGGGSQGAQHWGAGTVGGFSGADGSITTDQAGPRRANFAPFGGEGRRLGQENHNQ